VGHPFRIDLVLRAPKSDQADPFLPGGFSEAAGLGVGP